jgi:hypothetical protein
MVMTWAALMFMSRRYGERYARAAPALVADWTQMRAEVDWGYARRGGSLIAHATSASRRGC